jgi:hypothetical protein
MRDNDRRRYEMLARVRDFGATYGQLFPESSLAPQAFASITTGIAQIEAHHLAERTATVSARATRKVAARKALRERLIKVAATARVIAETSPGLQAQFALPETGTDPLLLTVARQFAQHAAPCAAQFVAHGMPAAFMADLEASIAAFESAIRDRGMSRDEKVAARGSIKSVLASALAAVRKLDVIVANHAALDPVVREVWKGDRRISYPAGSRKGADKPAADASAAAA